ncbi:hypothetical protein WMF31_17555 [Sorangium sp. So ce1036]|uniref:hypothetical protein n=1 Tax=Sorangium sp. So ce1036 TaxID=3133328 RepID=UPI003F08E620
MRSSLLPPETPQSFLLAAEERYFDAAELLTRGRTTGAIDLAGFVVEMLLKHAAFRLRGAGPGTAVGPSFGPAMKWATELIRTIDPERKHSLWFWAQFVRRTRVLDQEALVVAVEVIMPVQRVSLRGARRAPRHHDELRARLVDEWRNQGTVEPRPDIVEETDDTGATVHIYVIWDDWGALGQQERSAIIMDAYEEAQGQQRALGVAVAMGLTRAEGQRMGVSGG